MPTRHITKGGWKTSDIDETENEFRARVKNPSLFEDNSFRTIELDKSNGIFAIIGKLKNETSTTTQSYRFSKDKNWTKQKVVDWLNEKSITANKREINTMDIKNFELQTPPMAVHPDNLWWTVFEIGTHTSADGTKTTYTENDLLTIVENTKQNIDNGKYPKINIDHNWNGELMGMIEDIRYNDGVIEVKIGYLTPEASEDIKKGKYVHKSAEINIEDKSFTGLALLGVNNPAIDSIGMIDFNFSLDNNEDKDKLLIYSKLEAFMHNEKTDKNDKKDIATNTDNTNKELLHSRTDVDGATGLDNKKTDVVQYEKEKKEFEAYKQQAENEILALKTQLEDITKIAKFNQERLERKELQNKAERLTIPNYTATDIANMFYALKHNNSDTLVFSQDRKQTAIAMVEDIVKSYSNLLSKYKQDIVNVDISDNYQDGAIKYSDSNNDIIDRKIKEYAKQNKKSYNEALNEMIDNGMIY